MGRGRRAPDSDDSTSRSHSRVFGHCGLPHFLGSGEEFAVIDVRAEGEFESGRIQGACNLPLQRPKELVQGAPVEGPHVLHCQGGYRSLIAASLIAQATDAPLVDLIGGFEAWEERGLAVER
mgnify:CR=1 FL=1